MSVHYEACPHLHRTLEMIAHHGMKPGVVLNPATRVDLIPEVLPMVHHVLIMSVNPGFGGQEFIPFSLDKIRPWPGSGRNWDWHLESKWTAAWLTTRLPRSSKLVRSCWWRVMRYLAPASRSGMRGRCWRRRAEAARPERRSKELQRVG